MESFGPPTGFDAAVNYRRRRQEEQRPVNEELAILVRAYVWYWHVHICRKFARHVENYFPQMTFRGVEGKSTPWASFP